MAATTEAFRYSPLPESTQWIRILHLQPSTRLDAPLRGRLVETKLDAHADYHAVSYLWGDTKAPLTDWCDLRMVTTGTSDAKHNYARLPILASCNMVLRHLRWALKTRALWIDFICIDQSNSAEKSQQVRIMQYIYRDASKVAMWLDLSHVSALHCKQIFKWAKILSRAYRRGVVNVFDKYRTNRSFRGCWFNRSLPLELKQDMVFGPVTDTLISILDSPYFGRTWTVQELVMAPLSQIEMYSSVGTVQWAHILTLVEFHLVSGFEIHLDARMLRVHRRLSCRGSFAKNNTLLRKSLKEWRIRSQSRLIDLWHAEGRVYPFDCIPSLLASEPRDKAYAFLWALKRCQPVEFDVFNVDYTKTVETVFTEFTIAVAHDTGDLIMLFQSACQQDKRFTLPSWVPDWNQTPSFQDWNFLRPFGAHEVLERFRHPRLSELDWPAFQNTTMHIRGLRQADRVSRLVRVPALNSTDNSDGRVYLEFYNPFAIETLCVMLNKLFQMLDDDDLACLSRLSRNDTSGRSQTSFTDPETHDYPFPGALDGSYNVDYTILRGIIRSYIEAKRSPDPSDVDVSEWSRGLTAEFKNTLPEETTESCLLELSSYKDYPQGAVNALGYETHIVTELIYSPTFRELHLSMPSEVTVFASGSMGATIFKTEGGSLGLGQANIDVGDEVVQWKSVALPTVVRMLETGKHPGSQPGEKRCRLASVARVYGIMGTEEHWREEDLVTYVVL